MADPVGSSSSDPVPKTNFFTHDVQGDLLAMEDVVLNNVEPTIKLITLENLTSDIPLTIELSTSMPCLTFQRDISTFFGPSGSGKGNAGPNPSSNALYYQVGLLKEVKLKPKEKKTIRALFQPKFGQVQISQPSQPQRYNGVVELIAKRTLAIPAPLASPAVTGGQTPLPNSATVTGAQFPLTPPSSTASTPADAPKRTFDNASLSAQSPSSSTVPGFPLTDRTQGPFLSSPPEGLTPASVAPLQQATLQLTSKVHLSKFTVSPAELTCNCGVGKSASTEFSITNCSAVELLCVIRSQTMPSSSFTFDIFDYDRAGESRFGSVISLPPHSSGKFVLSLTSRPTAKTGKHNFCLQLENCRDPRNTELLSVDVRIGSFFHELLAVSPANNDADFCDLGSVYCNQNTSATVLAANQHVKESIILRVKASAIRESDGVFSIKSATAMLGNDISFANSSIANYSSLSEPPGSPQGLGSGSAGGATDLTLEAGVSQLVSLLYKAPSDFDGSLSMKKVFTVVLEAVTPTGLSSTASLRCHVHLHKSSIKLQQTAFSFGDTKVGAERRLSLPIYNLSEIAGSCTIHINSKIIKLVGYPSSDDGKIKAVVPLVPKGVTNVEISIHPRRVNPRYKKEVTITNSFDDTQKYIVTLESNNVASDEAKAHDLLYRIEAIPMDGTAGSAGSIGSGAANSSSLTPDDAGRRSSVTAGMKGASIFQVLGLPAVTLYAIQRVVDDPVRLLLTTTSPEIQPYLYRSTIPSSSAGNPPDTLDTPLALSSSTTTWGSGGLTPRFDPMQLHFHDLHEEISRYFKISPTDPEPKDTAIERLVNLRLEYTRFIDTKLEPLQGNYLQLESKDMYFVYLVIKRTFSKLVKQIIPKEDSVEIRSVDPSVDASRIIRVSYSVCSSFLDLGQGQSSRQFGTVAAGEKRNMTLHISNTCESPLYFYISKGNMVNATFLKINNLSQARCYGFIRPFAQTELEIALTPGMKGSFRESLTITNVLNPSNTQELTVKAQVEKPDAFELAPDSLNFGEVQLDRTVTSVSAKFVLTNLHQHKTKRREFGIKLPPGVDSLFQLEGVEAKMQLDVEEAGAASGSKRKIEDEIEKLEQKIKIYERKGKADKLKKALDRVEVLRKALAGDVDASVLEQAPDPYESASEDEGGASEIVTKRRNRNTVVAEEVMALIRRDGVKLPPLGSYEQVNITVTVTLSKSGPSPPPLQRSQMCLLVFETSDVEVCQTIKAELAVTMPAAPQEGPASPKAELVAGKSSAPASVYEGFEIRPVPTSTFTTYFKHQLLKAGTVHLFEPSPVEFELRAIADVGCLLLAPVRFGQIEEAFLDAKFRYEKPSITMLAGQSAIVKVWVTPRTPGPQKYLITARNLRHASETHSILVEFNAKLKGPLFTVEPRTIDFGTVIANPSLQAYEGAAPSKTESLIVWNRTKQNLMLIGHTNLPHQLELFLDELHTTRLSAENPLQIEAEGRRTVYVRLNPCLDPESIRTGSNAARRFVAGVTLEAVEAHDKTKELVVLASTQTKAKAIIGRAVLRFKDSFKQYDFGEISYEEQKGGFMVLENPSDSIEVRFSVEKSKPLIGLELRRGVIPPLKCVTVPFTVRCPSTIRVGELKEYLMVHNTTAPSEPGIKFEIRCVLDDGVLRFQPELLAVGPVPVYLLNNITSAQQSQLGNSHGNSPVDGGLVVLPYLDAATSVAFVTLSNNNSNQPLSLRAQATAEFSTSFSKAEEDPTVTNCTIAPSSSVRLWCRLRGLPTLGLDQLENLKRQSVATARVLIPVGCTYSTKVTLMKHLNVDVNLAVVSGCLANASGNPLGEFARVAVGKVGAPANWADAPFSFFIKNTSSQVPMQLVASFPEGIRLTSGVDSNLTVPPNSLVEVRALLKPRILETSPNTKDSVFSDVIALRFWDERIPSLRLTVTGTIIKRLWTFTADGVVLEPTSTTFPSLTAWDSRSKSRSGAESELSQRELSSAGSNGSIVEPLAPILLPLDTLQVDSSLFELQERTTSERLVEAKLVIKAVEGVFASQSGSTDAATARPQRTKLILSTAPAVGAAGLLLETLHYETMEPLSSFSGDSVSARVRCSLTGAATLERLHEVFFGPQNKTVPQASELTFDGAHEIFDALPTESEPLCLGNLDVSDGVSQVESVAITTALQVFDTFELPSEDAIRVTQLIGSTAGTRTYCKKIHVRNISGPRDSVTLQCSVLLKQQMASVAKVWCEPAVLCLPPNARGDLSIFVRAADGTENSLEVVLAVLDVKCWTCFKILPVNVVTVRDEFITTDASGNYATEIALEQDGAPAEGNSGATEVSPDVDGEKPGSIPASFANASSVGVAPGAASLLGPQLQSPLDSAASGTGTPGSQLAPGSKCLELLNCTPLDGDRYSLSLKSLTVGFEQSASCSHDIQLAQNALLPHGTTSDYSISLLAEYPRPWVQLDKDKGRVKSNVTATIKLTATARIPGQYVAHLVIRSGTLTRQFGSTETRESRYLRVTLDAVAPTQQALQLYELSADAPVGRRRNRTTNASAAAQLVQLPLPGDKRTASSAPPNASGSNLAIEFGTIFGKDVVTHHYIDILNKSDAGTMDFTFSLSKTIKAYLVRNNGSDANTPPTLSNMSINSPQLSPGNKVAVDPADFDLDTSIRCSLSQHHLSSFHSLAVRPQASQRVFVFLIVNNSSIPAGTRLFCEAELLVRCRSVRDGTTTVILKFSVMGPTFSISTSELTFSGAQLRALSANGSAEQDPSLKASVEVSLAPIVHPKFAITPSALMNSSLGTIGTPPSTIGLRNPSFSFPAAATAQEDSGTVEIIVMGTLEAFTILSPPTASTHLSPGDPPISVVVGVKLPVIMERMQSGLPVLEEHLTIYNKRTPRERRYVVLRVETADFQAVSHTTSALRFLVDLGSKASALFPELERKVLEFCLRFDELVLPFRKLVDSQMTESVPLMSPAPSHAPVTLFGGKGPSFLEPAWNIEALTHASSQAANIISSPAAQQLYLDLHFLSDEIAYYQSCGRASGVLLALGECLLAHLKDQALFNSTLWQEFDAISFDGPPHLSPRVLSEQWSGQILHLQKVLLLYVENSETSSTSA